jgi:hypothetical protein
MSPIIDITDLEGPSGPHLIWEATIGDYRYEFHPKSALVFKGDAVKPSYEITNAGCDCPSAVYGNRPCKHEKPIKYRSDGMVREDEPVQVVSNKGMSNDEADDFLSSLLD